MKNLTLLLLISVMSFSQFNPLFAQDTASTEQPILLTHIAGKKADGEVRIQDFKRSRGIFVTEVDDDERWTVVSYVLTITTSVAERNCNSKGANYSNNCKTYVDAIKVGNTVEVNKVKVVDKPGKVWDAPNLRLQIVP